MAKQPPTKRRKKSLLLNAEQYDLVAAAWRHYKSYVGAFDDHDDEEIEEDDEELEEEDIDFDEILEVVDLLSQLDIPKKEKKQKNVLNEDTFASIQSILPIMLSMSYLHIANYSMSEALEQPPEHYFEQSLMYWPENPAANSLLADYLKQTNLGSDMSTICDIYVKAATYAGLVKDAAIKFTDVPHEKEEDRFDLNEMVDILVMGGALDMTEDDDGGGGEQGDEEEDDNDREEDEQEFHSCSNVEVTSSFMAAMLLSCLDNHDDALVQLQKFRFSHRIHPNVWKMAVGGKDYDDKKKSALNTTVAFEPRMYYSKEGVLPQEYYHRLCTLFAPDASYWDESDYNNRGYYSYYFDVTKNTRNVVEDAIVNHLLPMAERTLEEEHNAPAPKIVICGAEWWVHTRPHSANLGHPLHFDTDEWLLNNKHEISHPVVSSVLYLTGGGAGAGSTIVFDQTPNAKENATQVWLSEPKNNHFMNFPGNLLHGVLPCVGGPSSNSDTDKNRLTLMVGFWTRDVTKGMKNRKLYGPCGPLPPATDEHSWVLEAQRDVKQVSCCTVEATTLKVASPAWETIHDPHGREAELAVPLDVPTSLDHQYFVTNAPQCFTERLFGKDNC
ncbi:hypothetical protein ACHAWT_005473 [Skeletonema menzelii]